MLKFISSKNSNKRYKTLIHCALLLGAMNISGFEAFAKDIPVPTGAEVAQNLNISDWKNVGRAEAPYWLCNIAGQVNKGGYTWKVSLQLSNSNKEAPQKISAHDIQVSNIAEEKQLQAFEQDKALAAFYSAKVNNQPVHNPLTLDLTNINIPGTCHPVVSKDFTGFTGC